jgi:hypothetical protein
LVHFQLLRLTCLSEVCVYRVLQADTIEVHISLLSLAQIYSCCHSPNNVCDALAPQYGILVLRFRHFFFFL